MIDFKTAVFDMDGTIIDSLSVWDKIDREFLEHKRGIPVPPDYVEKIAAMSCYETAVYTVSRFKLTDTPQKLMDEWQQMAIYEYSHNIRLKEGVLDYFKYLKSNNKKIVLCTSSPKDLYEPVLKNNGIYDFFDAFACTCEAGKGKGMPDVYIMAAKKANTEPMDIMVFEDILEAAASAKKAGMHVCGVFDDRSKHNTEKMKVLCDYYIHSFTELLKN